MESHALASALCGSRLLACASLHLGKHGSDQWRDVDAFLGSRGRRFYWPLSGFLSSQGTITWRETEGDRRVAYSTARYARW